MQKTDSGILYSASDINNFLECRHLISLERNALREGLKPPPRDRDGFADLVSRKGTRHEERYLERLKAGHDVAEIPSIFDASLDECVAKTIEAMRASREVIYQACFYDHPWRGQADFLFRVPKPSVFGSWSYEVADTKLALHPKMYFLVQLCFYSELLEKVQGVAPSEFRVILGSLESRSFEVAHYSAYYRRLKERFRRDVEGDLPKQPVPVPHCALCNWKPVCSGVWRDTDDLSLVANIRRSQVERLADAGITTLAALGTATNEALPQGMESSTFTTVRNQARLQLRERRTGEPALDFLKLAEGERRGFALLPPSDRFDVYFDMEGNPLYWDGDPLRPMGLEYIFGHVTAESGEPSFGYQFACDRAGEKIGFEKFVDFVIERRRESSNMHVYHYANYEKTTLERLAAFHATREAEVDDLLRAGTLVDLFQVVRQAMQISKPSYSIKKLEAFYRSAERDSSSEAGVSGGAESIVAFEKWLDAGAIGEPEDIIAYNHDDCMSTLELVSWLRKLRGEAEAAAGHSLEWQPPVDKPLNEESTARWLTVARLKDQLERDLPETEADLDDDQHVRRLLSYLLDYHRRELRPAYWKYFQRRDKLSDDELLQDTQSIAKLSLDVNTPPTMEKASEICRLTFPIQETKLKKSSSIVDRDTEATPGTIRTLDPRNGVLVLARGKATRARPLPSCIIEGQPFPTSHLTDALIRFVEAFLATASAPRYGACADILARVPYRAIVGDAHTEAAASDTPAQISQLVRSLADSYLFVQGPPGSGKTFVGANAVLDLLVSQKRVGITANSHKALHNFLDELEASGRQRGVVVRGTKKCSQTDDDEVSSFTSNYEGSLIESNTTVGVPVAGSFVAITTYSLARQGYDLALDYLVIDEAGQVALADMLAVGMSARNIVLLGDPLQLPHVTQGTNRFGSGRSVLEHLLGSSRLVDSQHGILLSKTRRMHPNVCRFISEFVYEGELMSIPECSERWIEHEGVPKTGLLHAPVDHAGCSTRSASEAERILPIVRSLLASEFRAEDGSLRPMRGADILVVAPYNAQVNLLRAELDDAGYPEVETGTVDLFQGREAPAVIYSMTTSTGDDLPRDVGFLFSRNRLNVAISRAQCLAYLVYSPALLELRCNTPEQMELVNAVCAFVDRAALVP